MPLLRLSCLMVSKCSFVRGNPDLSNFAPAYLCAKPPSVALHSFRRSSVVGMPFNCCHPNSNSASMATRDGCGGIPLSNPLHSTSLSTWQQEHATWQQEHVHTLLLV